MPPSQKSEKEPDDEKIRIKFIKKIEKQRQVVELNPNDPLAWVNLASAHSDLDHNEKVLECIKKAVDLAPRDINILYEIGVMFFNSGNLEKARQFIYRVLEIDSSFDKALALLDDIKKQAGQLRRQRMKETEERLKGERKKEEERRAKIEAARVREDIRKLGGLLCLRIADLPEKKIRKLASVEDPQIRRTIAARFDLPSDLIAELAWDGDSTVRREIARRNDLTSFQIRTLVADEDPDVRMAIATKDVLPTDLPELLANDEDLRVRRAILTRDDLDTIFKDLHKRKINFKTFKIKKKFWLR